MYFTLPVRALIKSGRSLILNCEPMFGSLGVYGNYCTSVWTKVVEQPAQHQGFFLYQYIYIKFVGNE